MSRLLLTSDPKPTSRDFFDQPAEDLARSLLGKVIRLRVADVWLMSRIIETEAYFKHEKASHSSLGYTEKRKALFSAPGTIYMYYARGGDSLNFSAQGPGNAVLIKSSFPVVGDDQDQRSLDIMRRNNPKQNGELRDTEALCSGQTLSCKALGLKVTDWDNQQLRRGVLEVVDDGYRPEKLIVTTRLGIPPHRDADLPYRFIDFEYRRFCTKDPTRVRNWTLGQHYTILIP